MKPHCLLILLVAFACIKLKAQHHEVATNGEPGFNEQPANAGSDFSSSSSAPEQQLTTRALIPVILRDKYIFQENRCQDINGLGSMANGSSIITASGRNGRADNYFSSKIAGRSNWKYENLLPKCKAVTGLMMMAGSIPYLIMALQTKHKGLTLCSQKTTYGSFNKARKKVTGITFSVPIGK